MEDSLKPKMEDGLNSEAQIISETFIKQEIESEHEAEMHPPEFVNMAIKTEIPEICEPESVSGSPSFEDNHEVCYEKTYLVNDPIKKEGSDHDSNDMITGLPSCSLPPVFEDIKIKTQDRINLRTLKRSKRQALKKKKPDSFSKNNHCKTKGCTNRPRKGGHCRQHGGGVVNYGTCRTDGCPKRPLKGGHCREHGGTSSRKRCRTEGCSKYSLKGGNCRRHGGIYADKTCKTEGCSKWPIKNGRCRQHGGVRTRQICKTEGCNKCPLKNGHCMRHGGIRTRQKCKTEDCSRKPLKGGHCSQHVDIYYLLNM